PVPLPELPAVPANAAQYRLSPSEPRESSLLFSTFSSPNTSSPSPAMSHLTLSPLLSIPALERVHASDPTSSPEMTLLTEDLGKLDVFPGPKKYLSKYEHLEVVLRCIESHFKSLGHFMETLTENFGSGQPDPRTEYHKRVISSFLAGRTAFRPAHLVEAMYRNRYSVPHYNSHYVDELQETFCGIRDPKTFHYTRPALSSWAAQLVGKRCALEIGKLGHDDPNHPDFHAFLQASVNARMSETRKTVTQEDVFQFSMQRSADILHSRAPLAWFITECMAATRKRGTIIQVAALSSFAMSRRRSANGYFALPTGVYLFATKAHTDSMGAKRKQMLQEKTVAALEQGDPASRTVLDNIQQYQPVREHGLCKQSQLMTGTAATAILLDNCAPGAFNLDIYHDRIIRNERASLTTDALLEDIDFDHLHRVFALHVVHILCEHVPSLKSYLPLIAERFRLPPVALYLLPADRPATRIVPLGSNSRAEMETHDMKEALQDFDRQEMEALCCRVVESHAIFFPKMNMINGVAENHFGAKATSDPSSLSRAASLASLYIPPKPSSCDYYATTRTMNTICKAQFLDIWDIHIAQHRGLLEHFEQLKTENKLPSLDELITEASTLVHRYASDPSARDRAILDSCSTNPQIDTSSKLVRSQKRGHQGVNGDSNFTGDRVLANTIMFRHDFLLYFELSDAIQEGDLGRVCEVLKGASKHNYASILLDVYCLFKFEATKDMKEGIWNNWLVNLTGLRGKNVPDDQMQEWHNKFHEDMVPKHGGSFDDPFFRETISPNVNFFQRLKEEMETAFGLKCHRKTHTSASDTDEIRALMAIDSDSSSSDGNLSNPESVHSEDADLDSGETVQSTIGGSEWAFHMDEGDNGGWEEERSEGGRVGG
ncbi:hypothetical protein B0H14DRAFT_3713590, partial [Mycena olivaceomarginata]